MMNKVAEYIMKRYANIPSVLYHGTGIDKLKDILSNGLNPNKTNSSQKAIYLTNNPYIAFNYSSYLGDRDEENHIILEIKISNLNSNKFGADDYELQDMIDDDEYPELIKGRTSWKEFTPEESLRICEQLVYYDLIPASNIIGVYKYDKNKARLIKYDSRTQTI